MRLLAWFLCLFWGHTSLVSAGFSSSSVESLEPVLGARLIFKSESEQTRRKREESHQPFPSALTLNFEAFGTTFSFDLEVHRELTTGGKITFSGGDDDPVEERPLHHKVYRGVQQNELGEEIGWINLVAHEDGLFHSIMMVDGELYVVDPLRTHERELDSVVKRDLQAQSDLVIYKTSEMKLGDRLCGAVSSNIRTARNETSNKEIEFGEGTTTYHPQGRIGRGLQTVARWTNCFPSDTVTRRFDVALYADRGYYAVVGGTQVKAEEAILGLLSTSNLVYYTQVNVYLFPGTIMVKTEANSDSFNQVRGSCTTIDVTLTRFKNWRATQTSNNNDGTYHLLTDCYPPPGTVGLAYVGVLCDKGWSSGVTTFSSESWLTFAHELGHNFGANHTFQNGQGTTGGIMDYGDGKLNGEYQFHTTYSKSQICGEITSSMAMTGSSKVTNCWKTYAPECGNGVIESGEDCDDTSICCSGCKFTSGSVCSGGECCSSSCQFLPTTTNCGIQSYCTNGKCTQSPCALYSNLVYCNMSSFNPCLQTCLYNGKCTNLTSFKDIAAFAPDGSVCRTSPSSTCQSGACVASTSTQWFIGSWSTCSLACGDETMTRTVECRSPAGAKVDDSQCNTTKPFTSASCGHPACSEITFVWIKIEGPCSATSCNETGTQTNTIMCQIQGGATVADSYCITYTTTSKLPTSEACLGPCSAGTYWWVPLDDQWDQCSAACGENGTQFLLYECQDRGSGQKVSSSKCPTSMPQTISRSCVGACSSTAIIGIAVGVVGGLVIIGAVAGTLAYFLVIKKRAPPKRGGTSTERLHTEPSHSSSQLELSSPSKASPPAPTFARTTGAAPPPPKQASAPPKPTSAPPKAAPGPSRPPVAAVPPPPKPSSAPPKPLSPPPPPSSGAKPPVPKPPASKPPAPPKPVGYR